MESTLSFIPGFMLIISELKSKDKLRLFFIRNKNVIIKILIKKRKFYFLNNKKIQNYHTKTYPEKFLSK